MVYTSIRTQLMTESPCRPANNTIIFGRDGHCGPRFPNTQQGCTTWRGGQYDERSQTKSTPPRNAYPLEDPQQYPELNFLSDTLKLNENVTLSNMPLAMPLAEALRDGPLSVYHPRFAVGLGRNSTMLNRLVSQDLIKSRSWSMFWGWFGATAQTQRDGTFIFGGYDKARVKGPGFTHALRAPTDDCPTGMLVTISDLTLHFPNGSAARLLPESRSAAIQSCIVPDYPAFMTIPVDPYFNSFVNLTGTNVTTASTGGLNIGTLVYKLDQGEIPYPGDLAVTLQSGLTVRLPNHQLVVPERTIQPNTGRVVVNGRLPNLVLNPAARPDLSQLGQMFLSAAYLLVNHDADTFTLWEAADPTSVGREEIVGVDGRGGEISSAGGACRGEGGLSSGNGSGGSNSSVSAGVIAGSVLASLVGVGVMAGGVWFFLRRRRRRRVSEMDSGREYGDGSGLGALHGGRPELPGYATYAEMAAGLGVNNRDGYYKPELESTGTPVSPETVIGVEKDGRGYPQRAELGGHELPG